MSVFSVIGLKQEERASFGEMMLWLMLCPKGLEKIEKYNIER